MTKIHGIEFSQAELVILTITHEAFIASVKDRTGSVPVGVDSHTAFCPECTTINIKLASGDAAFIPKKAYLEATIKLWDAIGETECKDAKEILKPHLASLKRDYDELEMDKAKEDLKSWKQAGLELM